MVDLGYYFYWLAQFELIYFIFDMVSSIKICFSFSWFLSLSLVYAPHPLVLDWIEKPDMFNI